MALALSGTGSTAVQERPATAAPAPAKVPAKPPSALSQPDQVKLSLGPKELKAKLAPIFTTIEKAGYPEVAQDLRKAHFILTDGKTMGMEYYAAAYGIGGVVAISRDSFKDLSDKEMASLLIHEGTHLGQKPGFKFLSGILSLGGRKLAKDAAEKEAYLKQWSAMGALDLHGGEMYWTCQFALEEMGIKVAETRVRPITKVKPQAKP